MKDYRVEVRIKNNKLYNAIIKDSGSIRAFARKYHMCVISLYRFINMKEESIYLKDGVTLCSTVQALCNILCKSVCELFPEQYYLPKNKFTITANKSELVSLSHSPEAYQIAGPDDALTDYTNKELIKALGYVLSTLSLSEERILRLRYGIDVDHEYSYSEISKELDLSVPTIKKREARALRKLKHPTRSRKLYDFIEMPSEYKMLKAA